MAIADGVSEKSKTSGSAVIDLLLGSLGLVEDFKPGWTFTRMGAASTEDEDETAHSPSLTSLRLRAAMASADGVSERTEIGGLSATDLLFGTVIAVDFAVGLRFFLSLLVTLLFSSVAPRSSKLDMEEVSFFRWNSLPAFFLSRENIL